jgi:alanyl-tRNA synthetase
VGSTERLRGGSRIEFFCGGRALRSHRGLRDIVSASTKAASAGPAELPAAFERLQSEVKELKRTAKDLHSRLATHEADALASRAESIGPIRFTFPVIDGSDANTLKQIATAIVTRPGHAAVVLSHRRQRSGRREIDGCLTRCRCAPQGDDRAFQRQAASADLLRAAT